MALDTLDTFLQYVAITIASWLMESYTVMKFYVHSTLFLTRHHYYCKLLLR